MITEICRDYANCFLDMFHSKWSDLKIGDLVVWSSIAKLNPVNGGGGGGGGEMKIRGLKIRSSHSDIPLP